MKRKLLPKSLLLTATVFSLSSYIFVNLHASRTMPTQTCTQAKTEQVQVKECDDTEAQDIKVPDVTVVGRVIELVQKFLPVSN
jgi:hypothetical protein